MRERRVKIRSHSRVFDRFARQKPRTGHTPGMRGIRLGMRWWLALAFASIVALTSLVVAGNALHSTSQSLRGHAQDLAIGNSLRASVELADAVDKGNLDKAITQVAAARRLSLFAFDRNGSPIAPTSLPLARRPAARHPLAPDRRSRPRSAGNRYIHTANDGSSTLVALPLRRHGVAAVLAYSPRPDVATELDIVKRSIVESALLAVAIGAARGHHRGDPDRAAPAADRRGRAADRRRRLRGRAQAAVAGRARRARGHDRPDARAPARELRSHGIGAPPARGAARAPARGRRARRSRSLGRLRERRGAAHPRGRHARARRPAARSLARAVAAHAGRRALPARRDRLRGAGHARRRAHLPRRRHPGRARRRHDRAGADRRVGARTT